MFFPGDQIEKGKESSDDENDDTEEGEDEENEAKPAETVDENEKKTGNGDVAEEKPDQSESGDGGNEEEGAEDQEVDDDLQLSWEILEMAKVIYQRKADEDKEAAIKLSEVCILILIQ